MKRFVAAQTILYALMIWQILLDLGGRHIPEPGTATVAFNLVTSICSVGLIWGLILLANDHTPERPR